MVDALVTILGIGVAIGFAALCAWAILRSLADPSPAEGQTSVCGGCGYDLSGLDTSTCPECGEALEDVGVMSARSFNRWASGKSNGVAGVIGPWAVAMFLAMGLYNLGPVVGVTHAVRTWTLEPTWWSGPVFEIEVDTLTRRPLGPSTTEEFKLRPSEVGVRPAAAAGGVSPSYPSIETDGQLVRAFDGAGALLWTTESRDDLSVPLMIEWLRIARTAHAGAASVAPDKPADDYEREAVVLNRILQGETRMELFIHNSGLNPQLRTSRSVSWPSLVAGNAFVWLVRLAWLALLTVAIVMFRRTRRASLHRAQEAGRAIVSGSAPATGLAPGAG